MNVPLGVPLIDHLHARVAGVDPRVFRVGVALPMSGVLSQVGPSALEAVILAASEAQRERGRSERKVELVLVDSGGRASRVASDIEQLASGGLVEAFVGLHTSDTQAAIENSLGDSATPFVFTPGHEGDGHPSGFFRSGESPDQLTQGLATVMRRHGATEWAIVGSDYVWPRAMSAASRRTIESAGGVVVMDRLVGIGLVTSALPDLLAELATSRARGVVINMPGSELTLLLSALHSSGLDRSLIRYSGCLEENALYAVGGDRSGTLYSALHSFESLDSPRRVALNDRYHNAFGGDSPVLNSWAEHCYDGIHFVARLELEGLLKSADGRTPSLDVTAPHEERYDVHLAVAEGMKFAVL